jgi:hypothetical protein
VGSLGWNLKGVKANQMKITKRQLTRIIAEEVSCLVESSQSGGSDPYGDARHLDPTAHQWSPGGRKSAASKHSRQIARQEIEAGEGYISSEYQSMELRRLRLSPVDAERLASVGGSVAELGPDVQTNTWNINNSVLAAVDENGQLWFLRPHKEDLVDRLTIALKGLESMGFKQSGNIPVPAWR